MSEFTLPAPEVADVPTVTRTRTPKANPFVVEKMFPTAEGKALIFTLPYETDGDQKSARAVQSMARKAAALLDVDGVLYRAKIKPEVSEDGKNIKLTIWTVAKAPEAVEEAPVEAPKAPAKGKGK